MDHHYSDLGLPPSATKEEVKAAFRKHALQHHPDLHINSPEVVKKNSEAVFKKIKQSYEAIVDANFIYRDARSPGRAGFRRSTYHDPYASYYSHRTEGGYTRPGYMHFSQRIAAEMRTFWRAFTSSGSASFTAALCGLFIGGILFLEPLFSSGWERYNEEKLFKNIEKEVEKRRKAQLMALQAARAAREAAVREEEEADAAKEVEAKGLVPDNNKRLIHEIDPPSANLKAPREENRDPAPSNSKSEAPLPVTSPPPDGEL